MCTRSVSEKNVSLNDATSSRPGASSSTTSSSFSRPVRKYLNFEARATSSSTNYSSPLERYLEDAEIQVSTQTDLVKKAQNNIDEFNSSIPNIDTARTFAQTSQNYHLNQNVVSKGALSRCMGQ